MSSININVNPTGGYSPYAPTSYGAPGAGYAQPAFQMQFMMTYLTQMMQAMSQVGGGFSNYLGGQPQIQAPTGGGYGGGAPSGGGYGGAPTGGGYGGAPTGGGYQPAPTPLPQPKPAPAPKPPEKKGGYA